ncbi:medium-chain fatty-acid--CoA ligase [Arthrobacter rhombi]|uniref:AMP-binding protein n=1 Tax=Arthrobacter rhombi TaxID=71253 RepID=UPI0031E0EECF
MSTYVPTLQERYSPEQVRAYYEAGLWLEESYYEQVAKQAERQPDKVAVFDSTVSLTYGQYREQILRLAVGLKRLGIRPGERIVAQVPNIAEFPVIAGAANRIGAVIVPVMPIYRAHDLEHVLSDSGAAVAFFAREFGGFNYQDMFASLQPQAPALRHLVALRTEGTGTEGALAYESLFADGDLTALEEEAGPGASPDDPFEIVYTSGTTSRPKGCFHTLNTVRSSAIQIIRAAGYTADDIQFGPSPITHSTGLVTSVLIPLYLGASSHFMEKWEPGDGARRVQEHRLTAAVTATAFLQMLMKAYDPEQHDASSLRLWICAGSPIPGSVVRAASEMFPDCRIQSLYGRSENLLTTMCALSDEPERSITSDGRAIEPSVVQVVDGEGRELPHGEEGDVAYLGPSHMLGYWNNRPATEELFTPGGFSRSGDLGVMDAEGFVRITGRSKDIIIRGGMNISAREVEDELLQSPGVANVAVVAMPDERLGEKCCAFVVPADDGAAPDLETIVAFLKERGIATQKLPERLEIVDELPTTATGKIQKHLLRALVAEKVKAVR